MRTTLPRVFLQHPYGTASQHQDEEGTWATVIGKFENQFRNNKPLTIVGDGEQRRDFTHIDDVVEANVITGFSKLKFTGDAFNIGNGDNRSVNEIADMIGGDRVHGEPVIEPKETLADISKAKFILNWKPNNKIEDWIKTYKEKLGL